MFFTAANAERMPEAKYFSTVSLFSFIAPFLNRVPRCTDKTALTTTHSLHADIANQVLHCRSSFAERRAEESITIDRILHLKTISSDVFEASSAINNFRLMIELVDNIAEDVFQSGSNHYLNVYSFKDLGNTFVKKMTM